MTNRLLAPQIKVLLYRNYAGMHEKVFSEIAFMYWARVADMVFVNRDSNHAFEIKSDGDTLKNLEVQIKDYREVFDYVSICITEKHLEKAKTIVPDDIGIVVAKGNRIEMVKQPRATGHYNNGALLDWLNMQKASAQLKKLGVRGYSRWSVGEKRSKLEELLSKKEIIEIGRECIFTREFGEVVLENNELKKVEKKVDKPEKVCYPAPNNLAEVAKFLKG